MLKTLRNFLLGALIAVSAVVAAKTPELSISLFFDSGDHLGVGECIFPTEKNSDFFVKNPWLFQPSGSLRLSFFFEDSKSETVAVYPVGYANLDDSGRTFKVLFRIPNVLRRSFEGLRKRGSKVKVVLEGSSADNSVLEGFASLIISGKTSEHSDLVARWQNLFFNTIERSIMLHEDHELEALLSLRWAERLPVASFTPWIDDSIADVLRDFLGLSDVRNALPLRSPRNLSNLSCKAERLPEPLNLPQVVLPDSELEPRSSPLAAYVPQDFFYFEWPNWNRFMESLNYIADQVQKWSPGFFPSPTPELIDRYLAELGIDKQYIIRNMRNNTGPIALVGRDPFFAAGTSVALLISNDQDKLQAPTAAKFSAKLGASSNKFLLVANCENLFQEIIDLKESNSLRNEKGFRYARSRFSNVEEGQRELVFLYLSDPWFVSALSPRRVIMNRRIARANARIRLVELLRLVWMREHGHTRFPSLTELAKKPLVPKDWAAWLLEDLEDGPNGVFSTVFGSLYNHNSIDSIPFETVTVEEFEFFEDFKNSYARRWRKIDPVALQLIHDEKSKRWITRLYVCPISKNSRFRFPPQFDLSVSNHRFVPSRGEAFGLSLSMKEPEAEYIRLVAFDSAPSTFAPRYWLEERWREDEFSWLRFPLAICLRLPTHGFRPLLKTLFRPSAVVATDFNGVSILRLFLQQDLPSPIFYSRKLEDNFEIVSMDLATIQRLLASGSNSIQSNLSPTAESEIPATIRAFLDLRSGAMLRRFLLHSALQNRGIESWRRKNRLHRISRMLGIDSETDLDTLVNRHVFPSQSVVHPDLLSRIPKERGRPLSQSQNVLFDSGPGYVPKSINLLPDLLLLLRRLDFFITVEENAILFETHAQFDDPPGSISTYQQSEESYSNP